MPRLDILDPASPRASPSPRERGEGRGEGELLAIHQEPAPHPNPLPVRGRGEGTPSREGVWTHPYLGALLVIASILYPAIVYLTRSAVSPLIFVLAAIGLIAARVLTLDAGQAALWRKPLLVSGLVIALLAVLDAPIAAKAYPVVMSFAFASVFLVSLAYPPSLVERFARLTEFDLPPAGQAYCRAVTLVWGLWLVANGIIAAMLAVAGSEEAWALWTGLIAYAVMGVLFAGERLVRRLIQPPKVPT